MKTKTPEQVAEELSEYAHIFAINLAQERSLDNVYVDGHGYYKAFLAGIEYQKQQSG